MLSTAVAGQSSERQYRNEFGLDVTAFIKTYLPFMEETSSSPAPTLILVYRRLGSKLNVRSGLGGMFSSRQITVAWPDDPNDYRSQNHSIAAGLGLEGFSWLARRWQVFYGGDARCSFAYDRNDAQYWNAGYANGAEVSSTTVAVGPIAGVRLKLGQRMSITTEARFPLAWTQMTERKYYIPVLETTPPKPDKGPHTTASWNAQFSPPVNVIFHVNL